MADPFPVTTQMHEDLAKRVAALEAAGAALEARLKALEAAAASIAKAAPTLFPWRAEK